MKKREKQKPTTTKATETSTSKQTEQQVNKSIQAAYMQASTKNDPEQ